MAGIYIHVPFCKKACHYCNFHFSTSPGLQNEFVEALLKEISIQRGFLEGAPIETIYFGGGTPSILPGQDISRITEAITKNFLVSPDAEITIEANPDDITAGKIIEWKKAHINRLSIGIQSFFEEDLVWMNRAHNAEQAMKSIQIAQSNGISNLTIDLIYGTPLLTDAKWYANVERAIELGINHLSCYALTVEPKTPLYSMIAHNRVPDINTEDQARQFGLLANWLAVAGFEHYEISNFARPGLRSRHNSSYWKGSPYLGLGPSAHSFKPGMRQWNIANNALYIESLKKGTIPFEREILTINMQMNEYIMTSVRTMEGINLEYFRRNFGQGFLEELLKSGKKHQLQGMILENEDALILSEKGKLFADGIASSLFFAEEKSNVDQ